MSQSSLIPPSNLAIEFLHEQRRLANRSHRCRSCQFKRHIVRRAQNAGIVSSPGFVFVLIPKQSAVARRTFSESVAYSRALMYDCVLRLTVYQSEFDKPLDSLFSLNSCRVAFTGRTSSASSSEMVLSARLACSSRTLPTLSLANTSRLSSTIVSAAQRFLRVVTLQSLLVRLCCRFCQRDGRWQACQPG